MDDNKVLAGQIVDLQIKVDALAIRLDELKNETAEWIDALQGEDARLTARVDALLAQQMKGFGKVAKLDARIDEYADFAARGRDVLVERIGKLERPNEPPNTWERVWAGIHTIRERNHALAERVRTLEVVEQHDQAVTKSLVKGLQEQVAELSNVVAELVGEDGLAKYEKPMGRPAWERDEDVDVTELHP